jgi:hypothetical protein
MGKTKMASTSVELTVVDAPIRDVMNDICRIHRQHRSFAKAGRVVVLKCGNMKAYVVARGPAGVRFDEISLDYATRVRLGVSPGERANFIVDSANLLDVFLWAWNATDAMPRVAARLGAISVALGVVGLILGVISLCR